MRSQKSFAELFQKRPRPQSFSNQWKMLEKTYALPIRTRRSALRKGWISQTVRGTVWERGEALQERASPYSLPIHKNTAWKRTACDFICNEITGRFYFLIMFWVPLRGTILDGTLWKPWKVCKCRFPVQAEGFALSTPMTPFLPDKLALRICYANSIRKIK